ncbi:MAG: GEVED domain-containing protein [Bacteroidota bacterium]
MRKRNLRRFYNLILLLLLWCSFDGSTVYGQALEHVQGELLIQLEKGLSPAEFNDRLQNNRTAARLQIHKAISPSQNIWRLSFDHNQINEYDLLAHIQGLAGVHLAQFNHLVHDRMEPNDQFFSQQWQLQSNSNPLSHLHIDPVWDRTVGGTTPYGDSIVLCILDSGFDALHGDLLPNIYRNQREIPNNDIDDDGNGYVDDYWGWNVVSQSDAIGSGGPGTAHGTAVSGICGALGDNLTGICGINWNLQMMLVVRGYTEAQIIQAYEYPLKMRRLYNQTKGEQGAFVVATNASWGLDDKMASEAPLWCALYDSLGTEGILNVGATTNRNVDIDVNGDLPTSCGSSYLIGVTNINQDGQKVSDAGYSDQHIDLGTFGKDIFTTLSNNSYGLFSGTSASAPHVTAAIGLLYATPCPTLSELARIDPPAAALAARSYLLRGARPNPQLAGLTVRASQLDINGSVEELINNCNLSECYNPYGLQITDIDRDGASVRWAQVDVVQGVDLRYRVRGGLNWTVLENVSSGLRLERLNACTNYELQCRSYCGTGSNDFSRSYYFKTAECCESPTQVVIRYVGENSADIRWNRSRNAIDYQLEYRAIGQQDWIIRTAQDTSFLLDRLPPCRGYECRVKTRCIANSPTAYSPIANFQTLGCGSCTDNRYCVSGVVSSNNNIWIKKVSAQGMVNRSSRNDTGYEDHTDQSTSMYPGYAHEIEVEVEAPFQILSPKLMIWIDLNQDGLFDDDKELLLTKQLTQATSKHLLSLPLGIPIGNTRMRMALRDAPYPPCGIRGIVGEVEDYCVDFVTSEECLEPVNLTVTQQQDNLLLRWNNGNKVVHSTIRYRPLDSEEWTYANVFQAEPFFEFQNLLDCRQYVCQVSSFCWDLKSSPYSEELYFQTKGCGACLDLPYCATAGDASFEWIESVRIQSIEKQSGNNSGYASFNDAPVDLLKGDNLRVNLEAGWRDDPEQILFSVWIDFDQNGRFDNSQELVYQGLSYGGVIEGNCSIPEEAITGSTKLRIRAQSNTNPPNPCQKDYFGETEDHCINIIDSVEQVCSLPTSSDATVEWDGSVQFAWQTTVNAHSYELRYRPWTSDDANSWTSIFTSNRSLLVKDVEECVRYEWQLRSICQTGLGEFSASQYFENCQITSTEQPKGPSSLLLYPNPCVDHFRLRNSEDILELELYRPDGQLVRRMGRLSPGQAVDVGQLSAGLYLLHARTASTWLSGKLLKL